MADNTLKAYLVSVRPSKRSTMTDHFRFICKSTDGKQAWIDARASMAFGHIIAKLRDGSEQEPERIPPGQYTVYDVKAVHTEHHLKPEPTVKQLVEMANTKGVSLSKPLQALIDQMRKVPDHNSNGDNVEENDPKNSD